MVSQISEKITKAKMQNRNLYEFEAKEICSAIGIPVPELRVAKTVEAALAEAKDLGYPLVLKIISPKVIHKSDVGGVILNISKEEQLETAFSQLKSLIADANDFYGVLIEKMQPPDLEMIIGMYRDPQFGPVILCGLGGVFVEAMGDVSYRLAPLDKLDIKEMLEELKGKKILAGIRGKGAKDIDAFTNIILKVSKLALDFPEIQEIDLNPVFLYEKGAVVVDARIIL